MSDPLFEWQQDTIDLFIRHMKSNFLCEATPAAGKTRVAAEISIRLHTAKIVDYIVIVVPTRRLKKQIADAFRLIVGLQLKYDWKPGDGAFPDGIFAGVVVTYSTVEKNAGLFRRQCNGRSVIVILDEIHHASHQLQWGKALFDAFELAAHRLLLSGTPFRSDSGQIPFVHYIDGKGIADKSYGYGDALADGIVREVFFPKIGGRMEWMDLHGENSATFDDDLDEVGQSRRLRTALQLDDGGVLLTMIQQAHRDLSEMRETDRNAAGLIIAMDQEHARDIALAMQQAIGIDPVISISDDEKADDAIEKFTTNDTPWIVAVRMVSEGVDIPRLRVCVYASNIVTELFFRQVVGRVVRRERDSDQHWAHVYIPDDPRLRKYAEDIRNQRELVVGKESDPGCDGPSERSPSFWSPISSTAEHAGAIGGEEYFTPAELTHARKTKLQHINTAALSDVQVAILLRNTGAGTVAGATLGPAPPEDATARLRKIKAANESTSRRIAFDYGLENKHVNATLNHLAGIKSVPSCSDETKLLRRLQIAQQWLASGNPQQAANG